MEWHDLPNLIPKAASRPRLVLRLLKTSPLLRRRRRRVIDGKNPSLEWLEHSCASVLNLNHLTYLAINLVESPSSIVGNLLPIINKESQEARAY